jgi:L-iditol 2-dehydrogenase
LTGGVNLLALVKYDLGINNMEIREVNKPEPKYDEVLIRVKATGICGTDLKIYDDKFKYDPPVIVGHEFSGIIEKIGSE